MTLLVVGDLNPDLVLSGDVHPLFSQREQLLSSASLLLGGSAAITAAGAASLGVRTALCSATGDDLHGTFCRRALEERGVDVSGVKTVPEPTGLSVILSDSDDRAILTLTGAIGSLRASDVDFDGVRHVHVASYFLQPALALELPDLFARARSLGVSTSLDTNWDPAEQWAGVHEVLAHTDVFLPNAAELRAITGIDDLEAAALSLKTLVVLKDGAAGAKAWWPGGSCAAPGLPVDVVDTTGAGDSFNAGFLAGYLNGEPLDRCVALAAAAGSLSTRAAGGTVAQATMHELLSALEAQQ
ncbi:carbohydrate kinase family protein [Hamadaea tsunoensis]|uniref:carbohydrate kinase family protein n=1 Tax=Hamadaea tsunoensis TaxID=53368 RepID=UPI00047FAFFD|nr:PfkB family carbohydrate kinase [Hamadaea tsunoensis]